MIPEDDYLRLKPAIDDHKAITRIAMMALAGCLILMFALVVQSRAAPSVLPPFKGPAALHHQTSPVLAAPGFDIVNSARPGR
jgi:hypothetical protein